MLSFNEIAEQGKQLSKLHAAVSSLGARRKTAREADPADNVLHYIQDSFEFDQNERPVQNLTFNVPKDSDFAAFRFVLYPQVKIKSINTATQGASEVSFRPASWSSDGNLAAIASTLDAVVELSSFDDDRNHKYQNAPFDVSHTYSNTLFNRGEDWYPYDSFLSPSGLVFETPWFLPKGSTMSARITTLFAGQYAGVDGRIYRYRIVGVLEGCKHVEVSR
jgi:hypothetical protein